MDSDHSEDENQIPITDTVRFVFLPTISHSAYALLNLISKYPKNLLVFWRFTAYRASSSKLYTYAVAFEINPGMHVCYVADHCTASGFSGTGPIVAKVVEQFLDRHHIEIVDADTSHISLEQLPNAVEVQQYIREELPGRIVKKHAGEESLWRRTKNLSKKFPSSFMKGKGLVGFN